jgi:hypothetical protein
MSTGNRLPLLRDLSWSLSGRTGAPCSRRRDTARGQTDPKSRKPERRGSPRESLERHGEPGPQVSMLVVVAPEALPLPKPRETVACRVKLPRVLSGLGQMEQIAILV